MQLMPATARSVANDRDEGYGGTSSLYDPSTNITLGATYYVDLLSRFEGNRVKALAAYNAGPSRVARWTEEDMAVDQWVDSIPFGETREYVQAVLAFSDLPHESGTARRLADRSGARRAILSCSVCWLFCRAFLARPGRG